MDSENCERGYMKYRVEQNGNIGWRPKQLEIEHVAKLQGSTAFGNRAHIMLKTSVIAMCQVCLNLFKKGRFLSQGWDS